MHPSPPALCVSIFDSCAPPFSWPSRRVGLFAPGLRALGPPHIDPYEGRVVLSGLMTSESVGPAIFFPPRFLSLLSLALAPLAEQVKVLEVYCKRRVASSWGRLAGLLCLWRAFPRESPSF